MKIIYANEELKPANLIFEIYGEPGVGKSSLAFTAHNPITLDFDHGAHRSAFRKDIVQMDRWDDTAAITREDFADYKTVIVDTVGRALDMLTASLIASNPKLATAQGGLTMSGYGALKAGFVGWLNRLTSFGLDVVLLAHSREDRKADDTLFYRPDVTGGSAGEIYKCADVIGFYHMRGGNRTIEFSPTDAWAGKDPGGMGSMAVPDFAGESNWLGQIIEDTKAKLGNLSEESKATADQVDAMINKIKAAKTVKEVNAIYAELREADKVVNQQCKGTLQYHTRDLGLTFDLETMKFVKPRSAPESADTATENKAKGTAPEADAAETATEAGESAETAETK